MYISELWGYIFTCIVIELFRALKNAGFFKQICLIFTFSTYFTVILNMFYFEQNNKITYNILKR